VPSAAPLNQSVHSCLGQLLETIGQYEGQPAAAEGEHRSPAVEVVGLPHILDLEGLLDAQDVELLDSPGVGLQDSPAVGVLHFQGMAEQELLVEEPQGMLHLGSQTSVKPLVL